MSSPASLADPIFILGILPRSGTNFLKGLLCLHPDCDASAPIPEDHLVHCADLLVKYVNSVSWHWRPSWGAEGQKDVLCQYLGNGLVSFLTSQIGGDETQVKRRIVTKTPSVRNLGYFFRLFPRAHLLILVRDGRAVVESSVKSFGSNYETMMRHWADAAHTVLRFDQATQSSDFKYLIVRYEDLWNNLEGELRKIFAFLGLNAETYDFDAAANLPVRGSSEFRGLGEEAVHWKPVEKTPDFNPLLRWSHWGRALHERFHWIAGQYLVEFGYEEKQCSANRLLWLVWNTVLDIRWRVRDTVQRRIFEKLPVRIKVRIKRLFKKRIV
ncbi:MAG: hypothetical protein E3J21_10285 [Anaerolineales bacterium]|nr:MAG: hypothetical protein E3J21_10285 [Anaerolineales bacterium]